MLTKKMLPTSVECAVCSKFGDFLCERCGETYCSKLCQMSDWREHRRFCMPIPRLVQRSDMHGNGFPVGRMLMDANTSFDATDAIGSVSEHSIQSDSAQLTREQVVKLTNTLNNLQIESKNQKLDLKPGLSEIEEVCSTPSAVNIKKVSQTNDLPKTSDQNNNSNALSEVKSASPPKQSISLSPPPKKQKNYNPSVKLIQPQMNVAIVHVEGYETIFVVPMAAIEEWTNLNEIVNQHGNVAGHLKNAPEVGFIVLAKPKTSDSYARGLIKKIRAQDAIAKVEFLDYGFTDIVPFAEMKCLTEQLVNARRLVNKVSLKGVQSEADNSSEIVLYLKKLQENGTELIVKQLDLIEKTAVSAHFCATLVDSEKFITINEQIKKLVVDKTPHNFAAEEITEPKDLSADISKQNEVEFVGFSGKDIELLILDNSYMRIGCFSAIQTKDYDILAKKDESINQNADKIVREIPFHPRDGEMCLAQSLDDGRWYRASSQSKIGENTYNLMYIDYGNMENVTVDRIRAMNEEFFFPCITALCFIDGICDKELSSAAEKRLKELVKQYDKFVFDEAKYTGEDVQCKSSKIINTLKSEQLI